MKTLLRHCLLLAAPAILAAQAPTTAPRTITIGTIDSVWSPTLKEYRRYQIYTPPGYTQSIYQPRAYPVLYLLDGDAHFHSVTGLLQILSTGVNATYVLPEMIVVAIPNTDRTRDLTPTHPTLDPAGKPAPPSTAGGMGNFLQFMKTELIPHIDSTFRTEPYRVFVGHSLGGITTINALYTMPETFNAYVAIDPSLWWDGQLLLKKAADQFSRPTMSARALFVGQANTKNPADTAPNVHFNSIIEFNELLQTKNRSGVRYAYKYYPDDDHGSVPMIAEYDALRFIFDAYKLDLLKVIDRPALMAEHFAAVSKKLGYKVNPPEKFVDRIGQITLGRDTTKAIALMQLNADLYPQSAHAFSALGQMLMVKRDTARAKVAYQRALELDPKSQPVRDALLRLSGGQ